MVPLLLALVPLAAFTVLVQRRVRRWWLLLPLAALTWGLVHASGVHATVAGVLLGFAVPVIRRREGPGPGLAEHFEHRWRPLSAGVAVPVFAFFSAGVGVVGGGAAAAVTSRVTLGIVAALVLGKTVGVLGATWLVQRFTRARLADELSLVGRARALAARRDRLHRLPAHRRARVRDGDAAGRPGQDRRAGRVADLRAAGHRHPARPQPRLPPDVRRGARRGDAGRAPDLDEYDEETA